MRVQCSLTINDDTVYERIQDLKEAKELNPLLVRLITAYVYGNETLLSALNEDVEYIKPETQDYSTEYEEIKKDLMTMDILLADGENLFSSASDTFEDYVNQATDRGIIKPKQTERSEESKVVGIPKKVHFEEEAAADPEMYDIKFIAESLKSVIKKVDSLTKDVNSIKGTATEPKAVENDALEETAITHEETSSVHEESVVTHEEVFEGTEHTDETVTFEVEEPVTEVEEPNFTEEPAFVDEPVFESEDTVMGEAASAMSDLLASL